MSVYALLAMIDKTTLGVSLDRAARLVLPGPVCRTEQEKRNEQGNERSQKRPGGKGNFRSQGWSGPDVAVSYTHLTLPTSDLV